MIVPVTATLGSTKTGLTIGYRVLNNDRTTFSVFTTTNVIETSIPGVYSVTNGVNVPDDGGFIIFGESGNDLAESVIEPNVNQETFSELTSVPPSNTTITNMIRWLYIQARNKITQDGSTQRIYADNGSTIIGSSSVSDDGTTATRGEFS